MVRTRSKESRVNHRRGVEEYHSNHFTRFKSSIRAQLNKLLQTQVKEKEYVIVGKSKESFCYSMNLLPIEFQKNLQQDYNNRACLENLFWDAHYWDRFAVRKKMNVRYNRMKHDIENRMTDAMKLTKEEEEIEDMMISGMKQCKVQYHPFTNTFTSMTLKPCVSYEDQNDAVTTSTLPHEKCSIHPVMDKFWSNSDEESTTHCVNNEMESDKKIIVLYNINPVLDEIDYLFHH